MVLKPKGSTRKTTRKRVRTNTRRTNVTRRRRQHDLNATDEDDPLLTEPEDDTPDNAPSVVNDTRPVTWLLCTGPSLIRAAPHVRKYIRPGDPVISLNKYLAYKNGYFYKKSKIVPTHHWMVEAGSMSRYQSEQKRLVRRRTVRNRSKSLADG